MKKARNYQISILALAVTFLMTSFSSLSATALYSKPIFDLTEKDQIILDIIATELIVGTRVSFSDLEEVDGQYPEHFEISVEKYRENMGEFRPTRRRYLAAIQSAAEYLYSKLFSQDDQKSAASPAGPNQKGFVSMLIGMNYTNSASELFNCIHDVEHIRDRILRPLLKVKNEDMIFMTDNEKGTDFYPVKKNILNQIENFVERLNKKKSGFFHYSGHGTYLFDSSRDELDWFDEAIVPLDTKNLISDDILFKKLVKMLDADVKLTMTVDCCHSGTILDLPYKWDQDGNYSVEQKLSKEVLNDLPNIVMISGCSDTQVASDGGEISGKGAGAMTAAFIRTIERHNYVLTYRQLLEGMRTFLSKGGYKQVPQLTSTQLLNLDDFYMDQRTMLRP